MSPKPPTPQCLKKSRPFAKKYQYLPPVRPKSKSIILKGTLKTVPFSACVKCVCYFETTPYPHPALPLISHPTLRLILIPTLPLIPPPTLRWIPHRSNGYCFFVVFVRFVVKNFTSMFLPAPCVKFVCYFKKAGFILISAPAPPVRYL